MKYPTRCEIIDVTGKELFGLPLRTPDESKPYIGQTGLAERAGDSWRVKITLDSGEILFGDECWWRRLKNAETQNRP